MNANFNCWEAIDVPSTYVVHKIKVKYENTCGTINLWKIHPKTFSAADKGSY